MQDSDWPMPASRLSTLFLTRWAEDSEFPMGFANTVLLPAVMRFNLPGALEKFAIIADVIGEATDNISTRGRGIPCRGGSGGVDLRLRNFEYPGGTGHKKEKILTISQMWP